MPRPFVVQGNTDEAAVDEHHHRICSVRIAAGRRNQRPRRRDNADTEQHERRELGRHFIVPDQEQFKQGAAEPARRTPQEDIADRAERSRFQDRTVLHCLSG
jgi:hypothetical protein